MNPNIPEDLKMASSQAKTSSRQALEAYRAEDFQLSRTLIKDAAMAGKKCQVMLYELQQAKQLKH